MKQQNDDRVAFFGIAGPVERGEPTRTLRQAVFLMRLRSKFGSNNA